MFNPWVLKIPGQGKGYPLQYSGLENSMDCIVHGVTKSGTRPNVSPGISLEGMMLKLKLQYVGHLMRCISEVIDISPGNLDSSLCFFQFSVSHAGQIVLMLS